jgi:septal ring factor EnvC (AmiA/AmiB activator)
MQDMPTIAALERRLTAALDRIGQGLSRLPGPAGAPADSAALHEALEAERGTVAQLNDRLRAVKERDARDRAEMEARIASLQQACDQQGLELQRLRKTVAQLRDTLTHANETIRAGVTEPQVINKSLLAEVEALRTQRRSETAEIEAILAALTPLVEEAAPHA